MEYHCKYDELVDPSTLKDNPRNVNRHPRKQLDALVNFIRFSGWRHAVVVSKRSGLIVAGHARKIAAIEIGCQCPVVYQDFDSDEAERTFLHADNNLAELADLDVVALELEVVELIALDIPVLDFGFEIENPHPMEPKNVEINPVDENGHFVVTCEERSIGQLIEAMSLIDGVCWERKK